MATDKTSTNANAAPTGDGDIMAELMAAFAQAAAQRTPNRSSTPAADVDPWAGVTITPEQERALVKLGWMPQGWIVREKASRTNLPAHLAKAGPQCPDPKKVANGEADPIGLANWTALGMICARLAVYGQIHVGHCAQLITAAGAQGDWASTPGKLATKLGSVLRVKVERTDSGFYKAAPNGKQAMHDVLAQMADRILKPAKTATKA
jgi:hypothetical protein